MNATNAGVGKLLEKNHKNRLTAFTRILDKMVGREFGVKQMAHTLHMTESGTRRYRRELLAVGLMVAVGKDNNEMMYRLTLDDEKKDAFLSLIREGGRVLPVLKYAGVRPQRERYKEMPRVPTVVVIGRDPLVAALFGPAPGAAA